MLIAFRSIILSFGAESSESSGAKWEVEPYVWEMLLDLAVCRRVVRRRRHFKINIILLWHNEIISRNMIMCCLIKVMAQLRER
jgi:hypothetical protein